MQYLKKDSFVFVATFKICSRLLELSIGKFSNKSYLILFLRKWPGMIKRIRKMIKALGQYVVDPIYYMKIATSGTNINSICDIKVG